MERQPCIYKIENLVNGKVYIGQTNQTFKVRIGIHLSALRNNRHTNTHLQRAFNKYGENSFYTTILQECSSDELDSLEVTWIKFYSDILGVYNLDSGGSKHKQFTGETLRKMSIAGKRNMQKPEVRAKMMKHWDSFKGAGNHNAKSVICVNTGEIFHTMTEASLKYKIPLVYISRLCTNERVHINELQFQYYEIGKEYSLKKLPKRKAPRKVILTNTMELFDTVSEGARKYNLSQGSISQCCQGNIRSAGKLPNGEYSVWVYEEDFQQTKDYSFHRHVGSHNPRSKRVVCLTTGEVFETMKMAGERYGIKNPCKISLACTGKRKHVGSLPNGTKLKWSYYY